MLRGTVKSTGYPLHSPVSPSLPTPVRHRVPSHFNWTLQVAFSPLLMLGLYRPVSVDRASFALPRSHREEVRLAVGGTEFSLDSLL